MVSTQICGQRSLEGLAEYDVCIAPDFMGQFPAETVQY